MTQQHQFLVAENGQSTAVELSDTLKLEMESENASSLGALSRARKQINKLLAYIGAEVRGVEWVPAHDRVNKNLWDNLIMWFSFNIAVTTAPVGAFALPVFNLGLKDALLCIFFFNALACATVAFLATLGPATGLRQMMVARFSFGPTAGAFVTFLNVLTQLAFSVIAVLVGAQTLQALWPGLALTWGIVIIALVTMLVCVFGYNLIHVWERYIWMSTFVIAVLMYASGSGSYKVTETTVEGQDKVTSILLFGSIIYGTAAGWGPIASDYNMTLPESTSRVKVFVMTFLGNFLSLFFVESMGAVLSSAFEAKPDWSDAFEASWGNLMYVVLQRYGNGFAIFCMLLLALSAVTINIPTSYSTALSIQALHPFLAAIPRAAWVLISTIVYTVIAIAGQSNFYTIFQNILSILSYWVAMFFVVLCEEHFLFRKGVYPSEAYNDTRRLPIGIAGWITILVSAVAAVLGMSQVWYVGVVSKAAGGGDLGFELVYLFAGFVYPIARYFELQVYKR
ncbi:permease for cytosine/purines, uracil, thiamine, allantoin-domain-containing protein [Chytriomyces sp. MP71]|nr:permease for cytosine/purines, uracil, thiamine, allantoin-domain-containing protein [Chytriomyces sp. MP71]